MVDGETARFANDAALVEVQSMAINLNGDRLLSNGALESVVVVGSSEGEGPDLERELGAVDPTRFVPPLVRVSGLTLYASLGLEVPESLGGVSSTAPFVAVCHAAVDELLL